MTSRFYEFQNYAVMQEYCGSGLGFVVLGLLEIRYFEERGDARLVFWQIASQCCTKVCIVPWYF